MGHFGPFWGHFWAPWRGLGGFWTPWRLSRAASGGLGELQGCLGARSGRSGGALGHPGRRSGNPLGSHWSAGRVPEVLQGLLQGVLGGFWAAICGSLAVYEIIEKTLVFIVFSAVGSCRGQQQGHLRGLVGYLESLWGSRRGLVSLQGVILGFLGALVGLIGTPREPSWSALGRLGAPPEATPLIDTKARITMQGVWGPLTDTVNSICNQFTGISYQLPRV